MRFAVGDDDVGETAPAGRAVRAVKLEPVHVLEIEIEAALVPVDLEAMWFLRPGAKRVASRLASAPFSKRRSNSRRHPP
jgi:hypothetical protein